MSLGSLLYVGRDSLQTTQMGIDITGANIANVNTPGYTRQRALIQSTGGNNLATGVIQTGVSVEKIERQYDSYLTGQLIIQRQNTGYATTLNDRLTSVESLFDETQTGGLTDQLNNFWSAWDTLSGNPSGQVERGSLVASAQAVAGKLYDLTNGLTNLKSDVKTSMRDLLETINTNIEEIRTLNEKIAGTGSTKGDTNIMLDQLDSSVGDLGEKIGISYYKNDDGTVNIFLQDGTPLVERLVSSELKLVDNAGNLELYPEEGIREESLNDTVTNGQMGALLKCQDDVIPEYQDRLDNFTEALADGVNAQHRTGYDSFQNTGVDFFTYNSASPAGSLKVNPAIVSDLRKIAAAETTNGDGSNATKIADIQHSLLLEGNSVTLNGYYAATVGNIGREAADSKTEMEHQSAITENVTNRRDSLSGVSIDEEMINLMKYQMTYNAAGRLVKTVNDMMDVLMSLGVK
ncbi:MAG: hypothetical protein CSYNP_01541 [Syntrophus sp. SKADARSKE-3]|nr:hypothetical protein [Syntrophus sp. SKADARSKE-3]